MSEYYPEGVSGFEDEIAGPRQLLSTVLEKECPRCGFKGEVEVDVSVWRDSDTHDWDCPSCEKSNEDEEWH